MKREVDQRKTRKALRKLRRAADRATEEGGPGLTGWEQEFVKGVTTRLEKYGSAFRDPGKGRLEEALSARQAHVARVIDKKSRKAKPAASGTGKEEPKPAPRSTFKRKDPAEVRARAEAKAHAKAKRTGLRPGAPGKAAAKSGWKPRVRDINDDPGRAAPDEKPAAKLRVIPGGRR